MTIWKTLWVLALTSGMRQGELIALRWPQVDLEAGSIQVVASMVRLPGQEPHLKEPKSGRWRQVVAVAGEGVKARHRTFGLWLVDWRLDLQRLR